MIEVEAYIKNIITCFIVTDYCGVPGLNMQQFPAAASQKRHRGSKCSWGWAAPPEPTCIMQEKASNTGLWLENHTTATHTLLCKICVSYFKFHLRTDTGINSIIYLYIQPPPQLKPMFNPGIKV